jgi:hypothetical protein
MNNGVLLFHQGWTDIINSIGLIHYLSAKYERLYVLIRDDARDLMFYIFSDLNDKIVPITLHIDSFTRIHPHDIIEMAGLEVDQVGLHLHGIYDVYGREPYNEVHNPALEDGMFFTESFYTPYGIPYSVRTEWFDISRDKEREQEVYEVFTQRYGKDYGLKHLVDANSSDFPIIELDKISDYFFDMFMVLEHAKEIHVIDSVWAAVIYHLQAKYGICSSIPVYISYKRSYEEMFSSPVKHSNWV